MLTITNADASTHQVKNTFSQSSESEFYDITIFFQFTENGQRRERIDYICLEFYLYIHTDFSKNPQN